MAEKVKVWFDPEADFLEVRFSDAAGFMRELAQVGQVVVQQSRRRSVSHAAAV